MAAFEALQDVCWLFITHTTAKGGAIEATELVDEMYFWCSFCILPTVKAKSDKTLFRPQVETNPSIHSFISVNLLYLAHDENIQL